MKRGDSKHLEHIVNGLINRLEKTHKDKGNIVREAWKKSAPEEAKGHAQPVNYKHGVLTVIVENSTWLYKLTLDKREIINKFNENYSGRKKLEDIRFRVGVIDI